MNEETLALFKELTEIPGASGDEFRVREFVRKQIEPVSDEIIQDGLGGIFGVRRGANGGPRILVAGHMDEVGFMVTEITAKGMIRFQTLGGWNPQVLQAQRVEVMTPDRAIVGVVASVPPHLMSEAERSKPTEPKRLLIDIGADSKADAEAIGIKPGQFIVPVSEFTPLANPKKIMAKAWDNRYGVGLAIELLKEVAGEQLPNTLYSGANVQEEVGLRGAGVSAHMIQPDLFFALDASPANDTTGDKTQFGQLGEGFLMRIYDRTMVMHRGLREFLLDTAETGKIPYQYFVSPGGTDAGKVHTSLNGIPSAVIGVPSRYIHSTNSILHVDDYAAAKEMITTIVRTLDQTTFETIRDNA
ncbi:M42 family glutamyl-aminopeptidase [Listeria floridensis FSL S10-1187]|uniref:M42 family glutamyl-aminopeptidase n=1 Tax=Listeria floridensis FSL S10-1187 TaxID=1265817 RepID=A0ABP3AZ73_9LIST|nr:M42 family metallopeptidase [Listeria floridensis]EUJ32865.1 M42 family glutamyl-aminopeptidase [Listeria floridensis FSL S10-1187]